MVSRSPACIFPVMVETFVGTMATMATGALPASIRIAPFARLVECNLLTAEEWRPSFNSN